MLLLVIVAFASPSLRLELVDADGIRLMLLMSFGLFPSAIVSLWHALFNVRHLLSFNVASRLLSFIVSILTIELLTSVYGAVGSAIGLAVSPLVSMLSFCLIVICSSGPGLRNFGSKLVG